MRGQPAAQDEPKALRLVARDAEDVQVVSACLQDALLSLVDVRVDPAAQSVSAVFNRFRWERAGRDPCVPHERILCGVTIEDVRQVQFRGLDPADTARVLVLLSVRLLDDVLQFDFAGGAGLRVHVSGVCLRLADFGAPWPTGRCPAHPDADGEGAAS